MAGFFRGLLCGVGIGFIIAPMSGQEMRRLVGERVQTLRQSLPDTEQIQSYGQQISDQTTQGASALKDVATQVKETASKAGNAAQDAATQVKETASKAGNAAQDAATQVKETASKAGNAAQQARSTSAQTGINAGGTSAPSTTKAQGSIQTPPSSPVKSSQNTNFSGKTTASTSTLGTVPGMEPEVQHGLEGQGITTTSQLLEQTSTKESRADLAQKMNIPTHQLKMLVDRADLMRLQGIGGDRATLLEEAGVTGCKDLQHRNPEHLYAALTDWQKNGMAASPLPTLDQVTQWIAEAKVLTGTEQKKS